MLRSFQRVHLPRFQIRSRAHSTQRKPFTHSIFADASSAEFLGSIGSWGSEVKWPDFGGLPEVVVTGRSNTGKSTLINAILGRRDLVKTSKKPGHTRTINFFRVGGPPGNLVLVDAPGYGTRGRREWGELVDRYLLERRELRAVYATYSTTHALSITDTTMLEHLARLSLSREKPNTPFSIHPILTKADTIPSRANPGTVVQARYNEILQALLDAETVLRVPKPLITSSKLSPPVGIDEVRKSVVAVCGGAGS